MASRLCTGCRRADAEGNGYFRAYSKVLDGPGAPIAGFRALLSAGAIVVGLLLATGPVAHGALLAQEAQIQELQAQESRAQASHAQEPNAQASHAQEPTSQDPQTQAAGSVEDDRYDDLEEVVVTAPRTLSAMRAEIDAVQNRAFALFNELNVDNDYDIVCRRETPTGSHIPVRVCRPRYVDRLEAEATQDFLAGDGFFDPGGDIMYHEDILKQKLALMAREHPEFHSALEEFYRLQSAYEDERRERFRDSWFVR